MFISRAYPRLQMSSFRHHITLTLNAEIYLAEEAVDKASEEDGEPLLAELATLHENYKRLIEASGLMRAIPDHLFARMKLKCNASDEVELTLDPSTAAETVLFLELLPPHPMGHTASCDSAPHFADDPASHRTFPYAILVKIVGDPACSVMWFIGSAEETIVRVWLHLPTEWALKSIDAETRETSPVLVEGLVPHQRAKNSKKKSVLLRFPKAYRPNTSQLLTWRDVPLLRQMAEVGNADPCLCRVTKMSPTPSPETPKAKVRKKKAPKQKPESVPPPPPAGYKVDTYACGDGDMGATRLGIFDFESQPSDRDAILLHPLFSAWLKARVTEKALPLEKLTEILVLPPANDAVIKIGSGEIDWTQS